MTRYRWREMMADAIRQNGHHALRRLYERHTYLFDDVETRKINRFLSSDIWPRVVRCLRHEIRAFRGQTWKQHDYNDPASLVMRYLWLPKRTIR